MTTASKTDGVIILDLGTLMDKQSFDTFAELKKEAYKLVKDYREFFVKVILKKHKIPYEIEMEKKDKVELFEKHFIQITHDEKNNSDKIYKGEQLIAFWNRNIKIVFRNGRILCKINYKIF